MSHEKDNVYGKWAVSTRPPEPMHADHILGAHLSHDAQGRPEWVDIQWQSSPGAAFHQLQMDFPNAMFLLSVLKAMQLDSGYPFPDDPRVKRK